MGAVGINFGSATSGAGFDVDSTVASIVANLKAVETPWTAQLATLKSEDTAFTSIGTDLATLSSSISALTDFMGVMAEKEGSSSDTSILTLSSASSIAVAGSHTVIVGQLAQSSSDVSAIVPRGDTLSGALTIQVGPAGTPHTIPVVSGTSDTLASYVAAINAADAGVTASVISDTSGSRLSLVSATSGLTGQLTVTSGGPPTTTMVTTPAATSIASSANNPATNTFNFPSSAVQLSGTFSYAIGGGAKTTINLGSTPLSLSDAANALNADAGFSGSGLSAQVSGSNLVITGGAGDSGSASIDTAGSTLHTTTPASTFGAFTDATAKIAIKINPGLAGQDATLTVDGLPADCASNTVSTVIPGVTFQLLSTSEIPVQVQIANDNADIETAFSSFVSAYNIVAKDITTQEGNDPSGNPEPLYGNTVVSQLQSALSLSLTSGTPSGSVSNLYQLGISVNADGTLKLDSSMLDAKLNSNYSDVVGFMQDSGSFGQNFATVLSSLGNSNVRGVIALALSANSSQESTLSDNVTNQNILIATQQANLTSELNTANEILQAIPEQLNEMNELYSAMTGYNTGTNG
jgi:flagellar hook-associated protein 2